MTTRHILSSAVLAAALAAGTSAAVAAPSGAGELGSGLQTAGNAIGGRDYVAANRQYPECATEDSVNCVWRNQGPGFSHVNGPHRQPAPRIVRVSDRLADRLINRHGTWKRPDARWLGDRVDRVDAHGGSFTVNRDTVISFRGGTTYLIRNGMVASS